MPALICRAAPFPHTRRFLWAFSPLVCVGVLLVSLNHWIAEQNIQHSKWAKLALNNIFLWLYRSLFSGMKIFDPESGCIYGTSFKNSLLMQSFGWVDWTASLWRRPTKFQSFSSGVFCSVPAHFRISGTVTSGLRGKTRWARFSGPPPHMLNLMS